MPRSRVITNHNTCRHVHMLPMHRDTGVYVMFVSLLTTSMSCLYLVFTVVVVYSSKMQGVVTSRRPLYIYMYAGTAVAETVK